MADVNFQSTCMDSWVHTGNFGVPWAIRARAVHYGDLRLPNIKKTLSLITILGKLNAPSELPRALMADEFSKLPMWTHESTGYFGVPEPLGQAAIHMERFSLPNRVWSNPIGQADFTP